MTIPIGSLTPLLIKGISKSVGRIIKSIGLIGLALGITIFLTVGVAFRREGLTLEQVLKAMGLSWLNTVATPSRLTLWEYTGQFPLTNLAGVESNHQDSSLADVYGTLVNIDQNKSLAVVSPQVPDYIGKDLKSEKGKEIEGSIGVELLKKIQKNEFMGKKEVKKIEEVISKKLNNIKKIIK